MRGPVGAIDSVYEEVLELCSLGEAARSFADALHRQPRAEEAELKSGERLSTALGHNAAP